MAIITCEALHKYFFVLYNSLIIIFQLSTKHACLKDKTPFWFQNGMRSAYAVNKKMPVWVKQ